MASKSIELVGVDALVRLLERGQDINPTVGRALYEEAQLIFAQSQKQVPFDEGVLSSSGMVHMPVRTMNEVQVDITYGGAASQYAAIQHENKDFKHEAGRKAKYLEDPTMEATKGMEQALKNRIEAILRGII